MANRQYSYQYETSPRKIKPDYNKPKRNTVQYNKPKKKQVVKTTKVKQEIISKNKKQDELKVKNSLILKTKLMVVAKCVILFVILFFIIFRNSKISESFSQIQLLKAAITEIQKENDQLEINIQNSINLNNIEQAAKELLGMQKLNNKQTVYINLSKKDYVEPRTETVIIEEESSWFDNLKEKINNIF